MAYGAEMPEHSMNAAGFHFVALRNFRSLALAFLGVGWGNLEDDCRLKELEDSYCIGLIPKLEEKRLLPGYQVLGIVLLIALRGGSIAEIAGL
jgi:hypothetical protein